MVCILMIKRCFVILWWVFSLFFVDFGVKWFVFLLLKLVEDMWYNFEIKNLVKKMWILDFNLE